MYGGYPGGGSQAQAGWCDREGVGGGAERHGEEEAKHHLLSFRFSENKMDFQRNQATS